MKKFLSLFFFFLFTITIVSAQTGASEPTDKQEVTPAQVYKDVKDAGSTLYQDVKGALQDLSGPLKVGAEHVYGVLVKQQIVYAVTWLIIDLLLLSSSIWFLNVSLKKDSEWEKEAKTERERYDSSWLVVPFIALGVAVVITLLTVDYITSGFINPEYGAIKEILHVIKRGC